MFKFVVVAACIFATAQAGLLHTGSVYAAAPVLGAPLLGKVTYNAPETTIVKQPVVVDQPEIRYRSVPTVVQTAPIVKTVAAAPALTYAAAPALTYAAAPALTYAAAPALTYAAAPALTYSAGYAHAPAFGYAYGAPAFGYSAIGAPAVTLLKK